MSAWLGLLLQATPQVPVPVPSTPPSDAGASVRRIPVTLPGLVVGCGQSAGNDAATIEDIVVCGDRRDRYRLPLRSDDASRSDRRASGEAASPLAAITPAGACGLFAGQRACGKAEAARYGYGQGRDPLTVLMKLGKTLVDPDADVGEPAKVP